MDGGGDVRVAVVVAAVIDQTEGGKERLDRVHGQCLCAFATEELSVR